MGTPESQIVPYTSLRRERKAIVLTTQKGELYLSQQHTVVDHKEKTVTVPHWIELQYVN